MRFRRPEARRRDRPYWEDQAAAATHAQLGLEQLRQPLEDVYPHRLLVDVIRSLVERGEIGTGARLLDYGCGAGHYSELLERLFPEVFDYVGFDVSERMIREARRLFPGRSFTTSEPELGDFDVLLASGVIDVVADYGPLLDRLFTAAAPLLILHRQAVAEETTVAPIDAYGLPSVRVTLGRAELLERAREAGRVLLVEAAEPGETHSCLVYGRGHHGHPRRSLGFASERTFRADSA